MENWFECKVSYDRQVEGEGTKKVTEAYLVEALSFTEAEARIIEEIKAFIPMGELSVSNIRRMRLADTFFSDEDKDSRFYRIKINLLILDEKSGKEKKSAISVLVQSEDLLDAVQRLKEEYDGNVGDYEIAGVNETALLDVYRYQHA